MRRNNFNKAFKRLKMKWMNTDQGKEDTFFLLEVLVQMKKSCPGSDKVITPFLEQYDCMKLLNVSTYLKYR